MFGIIIIAPLIQGDLFKVDQKYSGFKHVTISLLLWWLVDFLRLITTNMTVLYYLTLLVFPVVFLFVVTFYFAIKKHFNSNVWLVTKIALLGFLVADFVIALTNESHQLFLGYLATGVTSFESTRNAALGTFFYVHTFVSYAFLIIIVFYIMRHIINRLRKNSDVFPFVFILLSIAVGIIMNVVHIFVYTFHIDPTLLTITIVISVLYYVFYIRDLKLILGFNRNHFILEHLREKYVIVDEQGMVVDASKEFIKQFNFSLDTEITYDELLKIIQKTAVLFEESDDVSSIYKPGKLYLNTYEQPIYLPFYQHSGTFYLFFDQTANLKYIYDMNYIKTHDLMTEIYNRNFLEDIRDQLDDDNTPYQIALFDLDGLKLFNDYLGHDEGDKLLKRFASQLKTVTEKDGVYPIRLGGDEFIILAVNQPKSYFNNMIEVLNKQNDILPFIEKTRFSYALSEKNEEHPTMKHVLIQADSLMYHMKQEKDNYKEILEKELIKIKKAAK